MQGVTRYVKTVLMLVIYYKYLLLLFFNIKMHIYFLNILIHMSHKISTYKFEWLM